MFKLNKLKKGDKVAILSPSFAAPGRWPDIYELGLKRIREIFELDPIEFPTTRKIGASTEERANDLIMAFENPDIKAVITSIGGDDQVTYVKKLPPEPFIKNPKPFLGYSDNTHFANFLWLNGIPSYYGGSLFVEFAEQNCINEYTLKYLKKALFESGEVEISSSPEYNDIGLDWSDINTLNQRRQYEPNSGWIWDGENDSEGIIWGGCLESIDELFRHGIQIPTLSDFENIILITETSEELPSADYVYRVYRALGERGILSKIRGILVGRPKAWEFDKQFSSEQKENYKKQQREAIIDIVKQYNPNLTVVQNLDFGHTSPQIPIPYGSKVRIDSGNQKIFMTF